MVSEDMGWKDGFDRTIKGRVAYLVQLVKVPQNNSVVWQVREDLLAHVPPPRLLLLPVELLALRVRRTLPVIAAEERVAAEDDVLAVHPTVVAAPAILVRQLVLHVDVAPPRPQRAGRHRRLVRQQVIAPLGPQRAREAHEGHLDRSGPCGEDFVPCAPRVTVQVDQDVDPVLHDLVDESLGWPAAGVVEDW